MRVEIIDDAEGREPAMAFPPGDNYVDLRENPHAVERIAPARQFMPLRIFLGAVNSADSPLCSASASIQADSPASVSAGEAYEFAFQTTLVFVESSHNFERDHFGRLAGGLKELLEQEPDGAIRAVFRISACDFPALTHCGFCLRIRLVALGVSAEQAKNRCGLGLARLQQALLFMARTHRQ